MPECAECGMPGAKSRCSKCLCVYYCNAECQRANWSLHKKPCKEKSGSENLPAIKPPVLPHIPEEPKFRLVTVASPDSGDVMCACCCCAKLLKRTPTNGNINQDTNGPFFVRMPSDSPFPAEVLMGEPGSTGTSLAQMPFADGVRMAACLACATALQDAPPMDRVKQCQTWLGVDVATGSELPSLNLLEQRVVAIIQLFPDPDLSRGSGSFAGEFGPSHSKGKTVKVAFVFKSLEEMAFPMLFPAGKGGWNGNSDDLLAYTLMRLYSVDPRWRNQEDYVVFSLHRLVAFGVWQPQKLAGLPAAKPFDQARSAIIQLLNYR